MKTYKKILHASTERPSLMLLTSFCIFIIAGCAPQAQINMMEQNVSGLQVENQRINRELSTIKKQLTRLSGGEHGKGPESIRKSYARLNSRMDTLESELMRINGLIEQANYKQEQQEQELATLKEELRSELDRLKTDTKITRSSSSGARQTEENQKKQETVRIDLYEKGLELYRQGKYQEAKGALRAYIKQNPASSKTANAHFWIGDCEYKLSRFEEAILEYQKVISKFPQSNKVPDALLKQGFAFARLGDKESAKIVLKKLIKQYPASPQTKAAKKQLKRLG